MATHKAYDLLTLMNGPVREALDIPDVVYWGSQSFDVFMYLEEDFMKPVPHVGELSNILYYIITLKRIQSRDY
jgi:hypothetical protein